MPSAECRIVIASLPDRESVVAEIWVREAQFAELRRERDELLLEIYPAPERTAWHISYDDVVTLLTAAKQKLIEPTSGTEH